MRSYSLSLIFARVVIPCYQFMNFFIITKIKFWAEIEVFTSNVRSYTTKSTQLMINSISTTSVLSELLWLPITL